MPTRWLEVWGGGRGGQDASLSCGRKWGVGGPGGAFRFYSEGCRIRWLGHLCLESIPLAAVVSEQLCGLWLAGSGQGEQLWAAEHNTV